MRKSPGERRIGFVDDWFWQTSSGSHGKIAGPLVPRLGIPENLIGDWYGVERASPSQAGRKAGTISFGGNSLRFQLPLLGAPTRRSAGSVSREAAALQT